MHTPATMHVGPLGSTIHVIRADADTIAALAAVDWNRRFRRVCLDPVRGLITLMAPSRLHEDLAGIFDDVVETAADGVGRVSKGLRSVRLRGRGEPPGTGMEPDCTFYIGERAESCWRHVRGGVFAGHASRERSWARRPGNGASSRRGRPARIFFRALRLHAGGTQAFPGRRARASGSGG